MSQVLTDSLTHAYAKCEKKKPSSMFHPMSIFILQVKTHITFNVHLRNQVPCVYAFLGHGFLGSQHKTPQAFLTPFGLSLSVTFEPVRGFHLRGCLSLLAVPNTSIFFSYYATLRLYWTSSKVPSPPLIHQIW